MWRLQEILAEVAGLPAVSLQPAAGSQGELTGLMLMRAYFADRGEERDTIVTADTAHGTNPASVTMAGYQLAKVDTDARGNLDLDHLRELVNERTAGLMLDEPLHARPLRRGDRGGGADLPRGGRTPLLRRREPERRLRDLATRRHGLRHRPLQPAQDLQRSHTAAAGRAAGRWRCGSELEPFLPVPAVVRDGDRFRLDYDRPKSIGKVRGFTGPFGVFVRSYAYIRAYGPGLKEMSETAVLNANYLLARLRDAYELPYDRHCMHEFVLSARALKREHGITALDVAKRLMDYGIHPPTIYFPLVVPEALMIEPTETEPKETARRVRRRDARDRPRGGRGARSSSSGHRTTGRCSGSTRCARPSSRSSSTASRSTRTSAARSPSHTRCEAQKGA